MHRWHGLRKEYRDILSLGNPIGFYKELEHYRAGYTIYGLRGRFIQEHGRNDPHDNPELVMLLQLELGPLLVERERLAHDLEQPNIPWLLVEKPTRDRLAEVQARISVIQTALPEE